MNRAMICISPSQLSLTDESAFNRRIKLSMLSDHSLGMRALNRLFRSFGLEINPVGTKWAAEWPGFPDVEPWVEAIIKKVRPFTMTSAERISALCHAARYITKHNIPGDIVECGVWRGGSMMAAALSLQADQDLSRTLYLFDTFSGMPPPSGADRAVVSGKSASSLLEEADGSSLIWACASIDEVRANMVATDYPAQRVKFVEGRVEDTIPSEAPEKIAILRLDSDWYESTKHELINLYPKLSIGGILIIDDYGHWEGARKAVDEYINENGLVIFLERIDVTGRIAVKIG
jgi:O-methyltransferase